MKMQLAAMAAACGAMGLAGAWSAASAGGERCAALAAFTRLGPPLVCVPVEIGEAESLPWGEGAFGQEKGYRAGRVVDDTLSVLKTSEDVLVNMETLRRATVYVQKDGKLAAELLAKLSWIAMDLEADPSMASAGRARAWFNAAYFAACLWHMGIEIDWKPGWAEGVQGYAWMRKAIELSDGDPAMHFAAAIAAHPGMRESKRDLFEAHIRAAMAGAGAGSPLMRNIEAHLGHWEESVTALRGTP